MIGRMGVASQERTGRRGRLGRRVNALKLVPSLSKGRVGAGGSVGTVVGASWRGRDGSPGRVALPGRGPGQCRDCGGVENTCRWCRRRRSRTWMRKTVVEWTTLATSPSLDGTEAAGGVESVGRRQWAVGDSGSGMGSETAARSALPTDSWETLTGELKRHEYVIGPSGRISSCSRWGYPRRSSYGYEKSEPPYVRRHSLKATARAERPVRWCGSPGWPFRGPWGRPDWKAIT